MKDLSVNIRLVADGFKQLEQTCRNVQLALVDWAFAEGFDPAVPVSWEVEREQFLAHLGARDVP